MKPRRSSGLEREWIAIGKSEDFPDGKPVPILVADVGYVAWRHGSEVSVLLDQCPHRGAKLSLGLTKGGNIVCPYHGWQFGGDGTCRYIPAEENVAPPRGAACESVRCTEHLGLVWAVTGNEDARTTLPIFAEWGDDRLHRMTCGPYLVKAPATRVVENFIDVSHLPFVHAGVLGSESKAKIDAYDAKIEEDAVVADPVMVWQPNPDGTGIEQLVRYSYRVLSPVTAIFRKTFGEDIFSIMMATLPVSDRLTTIHLLIACTSKGDMSGLSAFQDEIMKQDIRIVESISPAPLPVEARSEVHLRSDRLSIAYRGWLERLGVKYGTDLSHE